MRQSAFSFRIAGRHGRQRRASASAARGVAMLLVLISLMMATILTSAYLASRDNSGAIGDNVSSAASARWVADSGVEFGVAVLQTQSTWRTAHINGRLLTNYALAGGTTNLDLVDMETGLAPSAKTEYVRLTSTGSVDGVDQTAVAECVVPLSTSSEADLDLSEFAVFASQHLNMQGSATVTRWPMAPLTALGRRVQIGTQATSASSIALTDDAAAVDTTVYYGPGASAMLVAVAKGQAPQKTGFLDQVPMPASPGSGVAAPPATITSSNLTQSSGSIITTVTARWKNVTLSNTAVRTLRGNISVVADQNLSISNGGKLVIDGQVKLVVWGDVNIDAGSIELKPNARLTMFVRGASSSAVEVRDGYIGDLRANSLRDATGTAVYMDPDRVQIFSIPGSATPPQWRVRDNSVVKASIYAPDVQLMTLSDTSALYGRIAVPDMLMRDQASLFYDPGLDSRSGYTSDTSAVWDGNRRLKSEIISLVSLDSSALQLVANTLGSKVLPVFDADASYVPSTTTTTTTTTVAPTDPTPRPVVVQTKYVTFGNALTGWE